MDINKTLRILGYQPAVRHDSEEGALFDYYIHKCVTDINNIPFIFSAIYSLGRIQGIRDERRKRRERRTGL